MLRNSKQEIAGYLKCLKSVFNNYDNISISEPSILALHYDMLIFSERDVGHKGHYKFGSNRVEAKDTPGNIVGVIFDPTAPYLVKKKCRN